MKRKTFYSISLSLPYIALLLGGVLTYFAYARGFDAPTFGSPDILLGIVFFFSVSGIVWGPLYTWMVIAMLFWGRSKNANEVRSMYLLSPVLLGCAMGIPALFVDIRSSTVSLIWGFLHIFNLDFIAPTLLENYSLEESLGIGLLWAFMAAICLVVGYGFVVLVLLIERGMKKLKLFKEEDITSLPDRIKL